MTLLAHYSKAKSEMPTEGKGGLLSRNERTRVMELAESLVPRDEVYALCAYGSRVAGYAEHGSDYNVMVVTKRPQKQPVAGPLEKKTDEKSPPIVIDEAALANEARRASAGDFAVGRLLNIYEPIINEEFLRGAELDYKKRAMAEELIEIQTDYADFSSNLVLPFEYFLFSKLHKRATVYPEAIYGYTRTYTCEQRKENLDFALSGFRESAGSLAAAGIVQTNEDSLRIFAGKRRAEALSKLFKMYPLSTGGAVRFALHAFGQKAGFEYKTKPVSQLEKSGIVYYPPLVELDHPKRLLRLEEGVVFDDPDRIIEDLAGLSGFKESYEYKMKKKGDFINSTKQLEIWDDEKRAKLILKHFAELKSGKWAVLNAWALAAKRFNRSPLSRLNREVWGVLALRRVGLKTHRIVGIALDQRTLITEYVEGEPLSKFVREIIKGKSKDTSHVKDYGRVLGKLHKANLVYGDTKPQNVLVGKDGIDLLDLEQTVENGDMAWDLAEFLYFSATHLEKEDDEKNEKTEDAPDTEAGMKLVVDSFLEGYLHENGTRPITRARRFKYVLPFLLVQSPKLMKVVRNELDRYSVDKEQTSALR